MKLQTIKSSLSVQSYSIALKTFDTCTITETYLPLQNKIWQGCQMPGPVQNLPTSAHHSETHLSIEQ